MLVHSSQSQAVSLHLAGLLLFQSDSDELRGCLAGSVVMNVSGSLGSQRLLSPKEIDQQYLNVTLLTPVICLHLNGEDSGINKNKKSAHLKRAGILAPLPCFYVISYQPLVIGQFPVSCFLFLLLFTATQK